MYPGMKSRWSWGVKEPFDLGIRNLWIKRWKILDEMIRPHPGFSRLVHVRRARLDFLAALRYGVHRAACFQQLACFVRVPVLGVVQLWVSWRHILGWIDTRRLAPGNLTERAVG